MLALRRLISNEKGALLSARSLPSFAWRSYAQSMDNITYSGGQPKQGQGGFYGSGGSRAAVAAQSPGTNVNRSTLLALTSDIDQIKTFLDECMSLEDANMSKEELTTSIKNLVTRKEFVDSLDRLQTADGQPIWGLSSNEHDLIMLARDKAATS